MDSIRAFVGRTQELARPAHGGDAQAGGQPEELGLAGKVAGSRPPTYVTWSGTSATVHRRIVFGRPSHGIGAEFA